MLSNRGLALAAGEKTFTGKLCSKCGTDVRYTSGKNCVECARKTTYAALKSEGFDHQVPIVGDPRRITGIL